MNIYLKLIELIINSSDDNVYRFIHEDSEIKSNLNMLTTYGSFYDKQEFCNLVINDIYNNGSPLAYILSRYPILWQKSEYQTLTTYIESYLRSIDIQNVFNLFKNSKYSKSDAILLDIDSNIYFNIMGMISKDISFLDKVTYYQRFFNGIQNITRNPIYPTLLHGIQNGDSIFTYFMCSNYLDNSIRKLMDNFFFYEYYDILMDICTSFIAYINNPNDISLYNFIYTKRVNVTMMYDDNFRYLVDILSTDIKVYDEDIEIATILYIIVNVFMDCFANIATITLFDPNISLFFINNRDLLGYF